MQITYFSIACLPMAMWVSCPNTCRLGNLEPILVSERGAVCIRVCSHVHSRLLPCAFASAPMCVRVCPRVRLCLPLRSPNLLLLESALLMAVLLSTKSNCGALLDGNAGMEHKKQGSRLFIGVKKSYCGKILISLPII